MVTGVMSQTDDDSIYIRYPLFCWLIANLRTGGSIDTPRGELILLYLKTIRFERVISYREVKN